MNSQPTCILLVGPETVYVGYPRVCSYSASGIVYVFLHCVLCCSCSSGGVSLSQYCSNGVLFAVTVNRVLVTDGVTLQALSLADGKVSWKQTLPDGVR